MTYADVMKKLCGKFDIQEMGVTITSNRQTVIGELLFTVSKGLAATSVATKLKQVVGSAIEENVDEIRKSAERVYQEARKNLKLLINIVKKKCWINLINTVDADLWGIAYKVMMRKFQGPSVTTKMELGEIRGHQQRPKKKSSCLQ